MDNTRTRPPRAFAGTLRYSILIVATKPFYATMRKCTLMDNLETIFSIQKELASIMDLSRYPTSMEGRVSALSTAIIHEAVELQRLTSWKWWKKSTPFDREAAKEELIDIWHFVVQASIELGLSPADILDEYKKKNQVNRDRQTSGY
jgi:dimeric dUTPase (all-alpha-NTP-PPase superfamily)